MRRGRRLGLIVALLAGWLALGVIGAAWANGDKSKPRCWVNETEIEFEAALEAVAQQSCAAACEESCSSVASASCGGLEVVCGECAECAHAAALCGDAGVTCGDAALECGDASLTCELAIPPLGDLCPAPTREDLVAIERARCRGQFRARIRPNSLRTRCVFQ